VTRSGREETSKKSEEQALFKTSAREERAIEARVVREKPQCFRQIGE
jgi:hypothetical protein